MYTIQHIKTTKDTTFVLVYTRTLQHSTIRRTTVVKEYLSTYTIAL